MKTWVRFIATVIQVTPHGVVVSNSLDGKIFFLRNYPYKVPVNTVIHAFAIDDGFQSYKDSSGAEQTVHAFDYGVPATSSSPSKPASKQNSPAAKPTNSAPPAQSK